MKVINHSPLKRPVSGRSPTAFRPQGSKGKRPDNRRFAVERCNRMKLKWFYARSSLIACRYFGHDVCFILSGTIEESIVCAR